MIIDSLPDTDALLEVVGFGRVQKGEDPLEIEVQIFLAELVSDEDDSFRLDVPVLECWIPCGQFGLVPIGSRWRCRVSEGERQLPGKTGQVALRRGVNFPLGVTVAAPYEPRPDQKAAPSLDALPTDRNRDAPCFPVLMVGEERRELTAIVPIMEVVRAAFGVSSHVLRQMFDGHREPALTPDRAFFRQDKSKWRDHASGVYLLWCDRRLSPEEIKVAIGIETSQVFRMAYFGVLKGLEKETSWDASQPSYVETSFPFEPTASWDYEGRWIAYPSDGGSPVRRFLITRIRRMIVPTPVRVVELSYPASEYEEGTPPPVGRRTISHDGKMRLTRGRPPSAGKVNRDVLSETVAELIKDFEIVPLPRDYGKKPPTPVNIEQIPGEPLFSTGDRRPGGDPNVGGANVRRPPRPDDPLQLDPSLIESLEQTLAAVGVAARKKGWTVRSLGERTQGGVPLVDVIRTSRGSARVVGFVLMLEVVTDHGQLLVVDAGSDAECKRSLGLIRLTDAGDFAPGDYHRVLEAAALHGGTWRNAKVDRCLVKALWRPRETRKEPEDYADLLCRTVDALFGEP
jgi:hypothetical protein